MNIQIVTVHDESPDLMYCIKLSRIASQQGFTVHAYLC